jgi:DNA-binding NtrC family response regulator
MADQNGRALAQQIVTLQPDIRVLLMSGHDDAEAGDAGAGAGWPRLEKPFTLQSLLTKVHEVLGS